MRLIQNYVVAFFVSTSLLFILLDFDSTKQNTRVILTTILISLVVIYIVTILFLKHSKNITKSSITSRIEDIKTEQELSIEIEQHQQNFDRLSQAEQRLNAIVNLIPHAITVKDQQGKIILANQSYADFFGKRRRDIIGIKENDIWPDSFDSERIVEQDKEVLDSYLPKTISTWFKDYNNSKKFFKINKVPVVDPVLDEPVLLTIAMDISDGYFREQILHARSRILESIVESAPLEEILQLLISEIRLRLDVDEISFVRLIDGEVSPIIISSENTNSTSFNNNFADGMNANKRLLNRVIQSENLLVVNANQLINNCDVTTQQTTYLKNNNIDKVCVGKISDTDEQILGLLVLTHKKPTHEVENYETIINETLLLSALAITKIHTENKLQEFNKVVSKSQSAILVVNTKGDIVSVNDSCCKMFASEEDKLLTKKLRTLRPEGEMGENYDEMLNAISSSSTWRDEIVICNNQGICSKIQASVSPSVSQNDNSIVILSELVEAKETINEVKTLAFYDALTGLHNRGLLFERLQQILDSSKRNQRECALILLDLDFFNKVNESLGHANGDVVLREIANRIKQTVRKEDIVARIDGDEFAIVIEGFKKASELRKIANNLMRNISRPIQFNEKKIYPSVSVGIGVGPTDADISEDLIKNVSMALYRAKVNGRNQVEFYEYKLNRASQDRLNLEAEMREGLSKQEFFTMFQPIYSESGIEIVAAEALVRWKNPKRGLVSPMDFIPIAEETGLIKEIGHLVFADTVKMLKMLAKDAVKIRVNLSARQFEDGTLVEMIKQLLEKNQLSPDLLALELTESLLMEGRKENLKQLQDLCEMGLSIAIDDFGTGYSSLSYLKKLPVDVLKIDRSFIQELEVEGSEKNLVDTILAIAQKLDMGAIAEGVETAEQLQFLRKLKFEGLQVQGFLLSKPLLPAQFQAKVFEASNQAESLNDISMKAG